MFLLNEENGPISRTKLNSMLLSEALYPTNHFWENTTSLFMGCRDGAVVRALASHQCGPGSIPRSCVICGLSLLVLYSAPRGFLRVLQFPLSSKTSISHDLC